MVEGVKGMVLPRSTQVRSQRRSPVSITGTPSNPKTQTPSFPAKKLLMSAMTALAMVPGHSLLMAQDAPRTNGNAPVQKADNKEEEKQVITVTDVNFEKEVLKSDVPVLACFGSESCGPCRRMKPELKKLANDPDLKDKIKVVKIDIDNSLTTSERYGITLIPDTRFFKKFKKEDTENQQVNERHVGYRDKDTLKSWVKKHMDEK